MQLVKACAAVRHSIARPPGRSRANRRLELDALCFTPAHYSWQQQGAKGTCMHAPSTTVYELGHSSAQMALTSRSPPQQPLPTSYTSRKHPVIPLQSMSLACQSPAKQHLPGAS